MTLYNSNKRKQKIEKRAFRVLIGLALFMLIFLLDVNRGRCAEEAAPEQKDGDIKLSVDPTEDKDGFLSVLYDIRNGLPTSEANAIAQTKEGFIWVGSYSGLIRYDSNRFERPEYLSDIANVRCLHVDSRNRLWVGTNDAGVYLIDGGDITHFGKEEGLESLSVRDLTEDTDGSVYLAMASGVGVIGPKLNYHQLDFKELNGQSISYIRSDNAGIVYGITITGDIFSINEGKPEAYIDHRDFPFENAVALQPDPVNKRHIFIGTEHYIYYGTIADSFLASKQWSISPLLGARNLKYIDSHLWVCARNGFGKLSNGLIKTVDNVQMNNTIDNIMTDDEGNLWVSSSRQGVIKIVPNQFLDIYDKYNLDADVINSVCHYEGNMIIGAEKGLNVIGKGIVQDSLPVTEAVTASGKKIETTDLLDYLSGIRIRFVMTDSRNRLWIGTARQYGVLRYDHGKLLQFSEEDGILYDAVRSVEECSDGSYIVSTNGGINVIRGDKVVSGYDRDDGFAVSFILSAIEGFNKEIIAGSDGGGIYIIKDGKVNTITTADGLLSDVILRVKKSTTRKLYWIVTGNSLAVMTPDYQVTTIRDFPYSNNYDIYENSKGDLWVLGSSGIYVIPSEYFDLNEEALPVFFGIPNGLPYVATANSYSELTSDNTLYMAGNDGVVKVNIDRPLDSIGRIKLVLPYVDADGAQIYADNEGNFNIPAGTKRITIFPFVLNYSLINPQVSYQLRGFDSAMTILNKNDLTSETYTNLPLGSYEFVMGVKDPISGTETSRTFQIIKGMQLSTGAAGSVILDASALFFLAGLIIYTSSNRKRGRFDDRIFFVMIILCIFMCISDITSYLLEGSNITFGRGLMIITNTIYYFGIIIFPFLIYIYLEYRNDKSCFKNWKKYLLIGIPCSISSFVVLLSPFTGWVFRITETNEWRSGPLDEYIFIPIVVYLILVFIRLRKINVNMTVLGIIIVGTGFLAELWIPYVSATSFTYALTLLCIHIYAISKQMIEEKT
ncbi:MAG: histidine kinase [Butyrivibrio sp.]|nr:histidine kinase [Butyrivibrio sp.]